LDVLNKIGNKIFNSIPSEIDKYFQQMIIFFNNYHIIILCDIFMFI